MNGVRVLSFGFRSVSNLTLFLFLFFFSYRMPADDLGQKIRAGFDEGKELTLSVIEAMGEEQVISFRVDK